MKNYKVTVSYEGTRYQGWQKQDSTENTIQGKLEKLLSKMCNKTIEIQGSGRTDAGVHAKEQVFNFHANIDLGSEEIRTYMNTYLPEDIAVLKVEKVGERFHSRLNVKGKEYTYHVWNSKIPNVFWRRYALQVEEKLDMEAMKKGAKLLLGEHDFKAFTSTKKGKKSTVRKIDSIEIVKEGELIHFTFSGNGFLYHMIRILMGTLIEIGRGERTVESIAETLNSKNRENAGYLVPAKGLVLDKVYYR